MLRSVQGKTHVGRERLVELSENKYLRITKKCCFFFYYFNIINSPVLNILCIRDTGNCEIAFDI